MRGTGHNGIWVSVTWMIFMLVIQRIRLVVSTTTEAHRQQTSTVYACEGSEVTISCPENNTIHVVNANYGRLNAGICSQSGQKTDWNLKCVSKNSTSWVRRMCSTGPNCTVLAANNIFGDPCIGTPKYLNVDYQCSPGNMTETYMITTKAASESSATGRPEVDKPYDGQQCPAELKRSVNWPATPANSKAALPCPNNPNLRMAFRTCGQMKWIGLPDLSECMSQEMLELSLKLASLRRNFSVSLVHEMMDGLQRVSQHGDLYGGDLVMLAKVMVEVIDLTESNNQAKVTNMDADQINEVVLNTTSNLLQPKVEETWMDLPPINQSSTATRLLCSVESSSALLANSINETLTFPRIVPGLAVQVDVLEVDPMQSESQLLTFSTSSVNQDNQNQIGISLKDIMQGVDKGFRRVTFALFDNIEKWLHVNDSTTESPTTFDTTTTTADLNLSSVEPDSCFDDTPKTVVNTRVISVTIVPRSARGGRLQKPVQYTLEHKEKNSSNPVCVFWDFSKETFEGQWSDEGCHSVSSNDSHTVCECDHLTNFAVLMSVSGHQMSKGHMFALSVITYIGCMISIVCLALAFITFYWFKGLQCDRNTIHKNLVLCLFISEVIFLLGIVQHEHRVLCHIVAGFLHYFFLASFAWMCLEGVQLYVLLIEVFEAEKSRLRWYYLGAYGIPALIVVISAAVRSQEYIPTDIPTDIPTGYCWLTTKNGLIWAFVGPVLVIICMNSVMLGVAIHTMCRHASTATSWKIKQKSKIDTIGSWVRGAVVLMILLGSTWTFGFLYVGQESLFMAYIFTILNSLQGLFIFIFHCLTNEKVQKEYRRCIQRHTWLPEDVRIKYGGLSGSAALSTTPNQSNSSGVPMFFRKLKNRKRNQSLSSSSFQKSTSESNKKGNVLVVISPPGEGSSLTSSHKVKRNPSSTSESARLTDSGIQSSDYLYDQDEITEAPSGYLDAVITHVDENEFNGPDLVENSALEESVIITNSRNYHR